MKGGRQGNVYLSRGCHWVFTWRTATAFTDFRHCELVIQRVNSLPAGGTTWSKSLGLVLFQIFLMTALNSSLAWSMFPSTFIFSEVRTRANSVALNITVPSLFKGMFMLTSLCCKPHTIGWNQLRYQKNKDMLSETVSRCSLWKLNLVNDKLPTNRYLIYTAITSQKKVLSLGQCLNI